MTENTPISRFPTRLQEAMLSAGLHSSRSKSGVCVQKLANMTGYSRQICRKYLDGQAIPAPQMLLKIAQHLNVNAGWLLFGDLPKCSSTDDIVISKALLHYVLVQCPGATTTHSSEFLFNLIHEMSQLQLDDVQLKKVVDLAFFSAN